jgi:DNA-binding NtrC family response regulator
MTEPIELGEDKPTGTAIIGRSRAMQTVYGEIGRIAARHATVLIRGETGTGKELVARAIYQHSERAKKPFIAVNCAAIPENLLESELFGHEKGAFTGADQRRIGRFEQAHEGTLLLDEIGDMSAFTQAKLLRVLQDKTIQRVGGKENITVDVRVIAATHRDLERLIAEKLFREDLYYRLSAVVIKLPPLRQRTEDLPDLAKYFLRRFSVELKLEGGSIQPDALEWLQQQPWPGNIRQLENVLRQAMLEARGFAITREHLDTVTSKIEVVSGSTGAGATSSLEAFIEELLQLSKTNPDLDVHAKVFEAMERRLFTRAYEVAHGNQAQAARWLKVSRQTMREKLQHFGVREPKPDSERPN